MLFLPRQYLLRFLFVLGLSWGGLFCVWAQESGGEGEGSGDDASSEGDSTEGSEGDEDEEGEEYIPLEKLVFVEAHFDDQVGVDGLNGAYTVSLSADGLFVYAASMNDDAVSLFSRNAETGELTYVSRVKDGLNGVDGLNGARSIAISPNGDFLYVVSMFDHALATFARNTVTGTLTYVGRLKDGEGGVDGLNGARSVAISPDGLNLYVGGWGDNAVAVFARDIATGVPSFLGRLKDGEDGIDGLDAPHFLTVSPDGKSVYVALWDEDAVSYFSRDASTGLLTYDGKVVDEVDDVNGLKGPRSIACSTDGEFVYVASWNDDGVSVFNRDEAGVLTYNSLVTEGLGRVVGMDGPHSLAISAEGGFLYVASFFDDAITVFVRDQETGGLSYDQSIYDSDEGVEGLNGALTVATSPDGEHVYLATANDKSLVAFRREIVILPPEFTLQPEAKSIPEGEPAVFYALADGADVSYQWRVDGVEIPGENLPVLTLGPAAAAMDGRSYSVAASNEGGSVTSADAVLTVLPPVVLESPDNLTALDVSNTSAQLEWADVNSDETGYEIQRKVAGGEFSTLTTVFADVESYEDQSLNPGTTYIYHVRARKASEVSAWSNDAVIESQDDVPVDPANLVVESSSYNRVDLRWSDRSAVETGYRIERRDVSAGSSFADLDTVEKSVSTYRDRDVDPNGSYAYRVSAYNETGESGYSNTVVALTSDLPVNSITPTSIEVPAEQTSNNLVLVSAVSSDAEWEALPNADWIAVLSPTNGLGVGSSSVSYRVSRNEIREPRSGTIEIGDLIHTVNQAAGEDFLEVLPGDSNFATTGGTINISVDSNVVWTATSDSSWIEILEGSSGENDGTIRFRVEENLSSEAREGAITVNDVAHPITQGGQNFYVILAPTAALFGIEGGDGSFEIQSNTDWTIETNVSWIQVLDTLTGNGNLFKDYSVEANDTEFSRVGRITVNDAYLDIVQGGGADKPIAPSETVAPWEGGESFTHELTVLGNPAIAVDEDWVEVTSFVSVDGEATLTFDVDENPAMEERLAIITIGSEMHAVRQLAKPLVAPVLSSFSVAGGALLTRDPVVKLTPVLSEGTMEEYRASESISFNDTDWGPIGNGAKIVLSDGWEEKRVYFQARNSMGESGILSDTIFLLPPPPRLVGAFYSDVDGFSATLICEPGHVYRILWSEDMSNWKTLEELTAESAEVPVVDVDAAGGNLRFYRVVCDDEL